MEGRTGRALRILSIVLYNTITITVIVIVPHTLKLTTSDSPTLTLTLIPTLSLTLPYNIETPLLVLYCTLPSATGSVLHHAEGCGRTICT